MVKLLHFFKNVEKSGIKWRKVVEYAKYFSMFVY